MSRLQQVEKQLLAQITAVKGIETINTIITSALADTGHGDLSVVVQTIGKIIEAVIAGFDGKVSADEVEKQLRALSDRIAANDAATDRALDELPDPPVDEKFDTDSGK
jgi:hypothetical protein